MRKDTQAVGLYMLRHAIGDVMPTTADVARHFRCSEDVAFRHLNALRKMGLIESVNLHSWRIPHGPTNDAA